MARPLLVPPWSFCLSLHPATKPVNIAPFLAIETNLWPPLEKGTAFVQSWQPTAIFQGCRCNSLMKKSLVRKRKEKKIKLQLITLHWWCFFSKWIKEEKINLPNNCVMSTCKNLNNESIILVLQKDFDRSQHGYLSLFSRISFICLCNHFPHHPISMGAEYNCFSYNNCVTLLLIEQFPCQLELSSFILHKLQSLFCERNATENIHTLQKKS